MGHSKVTIKIDGMQNDHHVETALSALGAVPGAISADIGSDNASATVEFDDTVASAKDFISAVDNAGFEAAEA